FEKNEVEVDDVDNLSFDRFLKEIKNDYENCEPKLQQVFKMFIKRYRAAKSQLIAQAIIFFYNLDSSTQIKNGAIIRVQPERKVRQTNKQGHNL
ncbi:16481_t:CDS:2, partial [Racocetra persica]